MYQVKQIETKEGYESKVFSPSFLQSWQYGKLHEALSHTPLYLGVFKGDECIGTLLFIVFRARRGSYLFLPYGIVHAEWFPAVMDFAKAYALKQNIDFIRVSPLMDDTPENRAIFTRQGFKNAPVHMMHPEYVWLLDISGSEEEILGQMRKNTRYYVKRAERDGVSVKSGTSLELMDEFIKIHDETAKRQGFVTFGTEYLHEQLKQFSPDAIRVFIAYYEGKAISGAVIVYYGNEAAYHHGASLSEYAKIPGSYLIQWEAILEAKRRGLTRYNFWGVVENNPKHPWAGLSFFKQGFGGYGRTLLHAMDFPITKKYHLNFLVETYRRIKRGY